jgi:outer membrane immunogenic protein
MSRKVHRLVCASALLPLAAFGAPMAAHAADIAPAPVYKAPPPPPPPPFSWTGFYIGGNIGVGWNQGSWTDSLFGVGFSNQNNNAVFIGGGQIGGNYQINNWVFGIEGDFDWAANNNNSGTGTLINGNTFQINANNRWVSTLAGRIGFAFDHWLFYAKGGGAWVGNNGFTVTNLTTGAAVSVSGNNTNSGWLAGGGIEWAFTNNWTVRAEYDFIGLNNRTFTLPATFPVLVGDTFTTHNRDVQMFTVGVNYLFNWYTPSSTVSSHY